MNKTIWFDITNTPHINFFKPLIMRLRDEYKLIYSLKDFAETVPLFEKDIQEEYEQIEKFLRQTVAEAGLPPGQIDAVVTTGGSSNIPLFINLLGQMFGREKIKAADTFSSVTSGLAIRAAQTR